MYFLALNWLQYCLYNTGASCFIVNKFTEISNEHLAQYCLFDTRISCSIVNKLLRISSAHLAAVLIYIYKNKIYIYMTQVLVVCP